MLLFPFTLNVPQAVLATAHNPGPQNTAPQDPCIDVSTAVSGINCPGTTIPLQAIDPNWSAASYPTSPTGGPVYHVPDSTAWYPYPLTGNWVDPYNRTTRTNGPDQQGWYNYTRTFTLNTATQTGFTLAVGYAADNNVTFYLNGNPIPNNANGNGQCNDGGPNPKLCFDTLSADINYRRFTFNNPAGFHNGQNTLEALVYNAGLVTGLQVIGNVTSTSPCFRLPSNLASNLVSWWPGDLNAQDIISHYDGTLVNGATFAPGYVLDAFSLNGVNQYVNVPDSSSPGLRITNSITVDAWVNSSNITGYQIIVSKYDGTLPATAEGYYLRLNPGGVIDFTFRSTLQTTSTPVPANSWVHIAGVSNGTYSWIYLNGVVVAQGPRTGVTSPNNLDLRIGSAATGGLFFYGMLDEVEVFNRALSAGEIQSIYNASSLGKCKASAPCPSGLKSIDLSTGTTTPFIADAYGTIDPHWKVYAVPTLNPGTTFPALFPISLLPSTPYSVKPVSVWVGGSSNPNPSVGTKANWVFPYQGNSSVPSGFTPPDYWPQALVAPSAQNFGGNYNYTIQWTMSTTGTLTFYGGVSADNELSLYLDGTHIVTYLSATTFTALQTPASQTLTATSHTLTAIVHNDNNYTGLLVIAAACLSGTGTPVIATTWIPLAIGMVIAFALAKGRRSRRLSS